MAVSTEVVRDYLTELLGGSVTQGCDGKLFRGDCSACTTYGRCVEPLILNRLTVGVATVRRAGLEHSAVRWNMAYPRERTDISAGKIRLHGAKMKR